MKRNCNNSSSFEVLFFFPSFETSFCVQLFHEFVLAVGPWINPTASHSEADGGDLGGNDFSFLTMKGNADIKLVLGCYKEQIKYLWNSSLRLWSQHYFLNSTFFPVCGLHHNLASHFLGNRGATTTSSRGGGRKAPKKHKQHKERRSLIKIPARWKG